ncbi:MAG: glycosyl transferase family 4, partial [Cyanobacteria bacterium P01_H01_bin.121]
MSIGVLILGFGISWLSVKLIWQHGATALLIDTPNERSSHTRPTPRGGGLGFVVAFFGAISSMIVLEALPQSKAPLLDLSLDLGIDESTLTKLLCLVPLAAIGFLDDRYSLPATVRYAVHLGVSIVAIAYFNAQAWLGLSTFSSTVMLGFLVVAMTALINFYNFMDGLDGLVASVTALQLSFLA